LADGHSIIDASQSQPHDERPSQNTRTHLTAAAVTHALVPRVASTIRWTEDKKEMVKYLRLDTRSIATCAKVRKTRQNLRGKCVPAVPLCCSLNRDDSVIRLEFEISVRIEFVCQLAICWKIHSQNAINRLQKYIAQKHFFIALLAWKCDKKCTITDGRKKKKLYTGLEFRQ
jgi:hypothetical protein